MINTLELSNFKSIRNLSINCARINIFIGEPNTGKSNILESLGCLSYLLYYHEPLEDFVRFRRTSNLFYDEVIEEQVVIKTNYGMLVLQFQNNAFRGELRNDPKGSITLSGGYDNLKVGSISGSPGQIYPVKFYRFKVLDHFDHLESAYLLPPSGSNLMSLLRAHKRFSKLANDLLDHFGLRLVLKPQENMIETYKMVEDTVTSYPYSLLSDTLQRVIFYLFAIISNSRSVLVFEEPESHAFPYYTKYVAEKIAMDSNENQYFVSTHNPYFLFPILEKASKSDVKVFITYFEDFQTKAKVLTTREMQKLMDLERDAFFNIDKFLERK